MHRFAKYWALYKKMFCGVPHNLFGRSVFYGCTLLKMFLDDKESIERHKRFYWQAMVIYSKLERFTDLIKKICYYSYWIERAFFRGDYDVAAFGTLDFYEICRNQLLEDYFIEKTELEYAGNACHFWFKKNAFLAEEINVSINKYKRPKIMYIPSERNVLSVVKNIEELDNIPTMLRLLRRRYLQERENLNW